jgi:hypothetical protein
VHCFALISFFVLVAYPFVLSSPRNTSSFVLRILIALPLFVFLVTTAGYASTRAVQFYADQCKPALPNNGVADDAAPLRTCMAAMPAGATMNLDGSKPYYFASHTSSDPIWGGDANCEISLRSQQTLNLNGATITPSSAEQAVPSNFMICAGTPSVVRLAILFRSMIRHRARPRSRSQHQLQVRIMAAPRTAAVWLARASSVPATTYISTVG